MEDLAAALAAGGGNLSMLGGGNPALIPEVCAVWRRRIREILDEPGRIDRLLSIYDPPRGNPRFLETLSRYLTRKLHCEIRPENLAVTAGGQTAGFFLLNLFAGGTTQGHRKTALLPILPEYIGYASQILGGQAFQGIPPRIDITGPHSFKYRVEFDRIQTGPMLGAICVSRPTNPTGNVLTDAEVEHLHRIALEAGIPLIIDNAYGHPFPGIVFREIRPFWKSGMILIMSLSKLGLPNTRTAIVVADPAVTEALASMTAVAGLSNATLGQEIIHPLLESGEIDRIVTHHVAPYYRRKSLQARAWVSELFPGDVPYFVHESEGAMFLWIWFPGLPVSAQEFYELLKQRGVLVVPGHHFAFSIPEVLPHAEKCIRLSFTMPDETVREGLRKIADTLRDLH